MELVETKYKKTEVGEIPNDWLVKSIQELTLENGIIRGPFGGSLKKDSFKRRGYAVYEQRHAIYKYADEFRYFIDDNKYYELKRFGVNDGDFIVSCSGTIGRIYKLPKNSPSGIINQALLILRIDNEKAVDDYFYKYFEWHNFQQKIIDNTQGGAMKNMVGMSEFKSTVLAVPPTLQEQKAIATALSDVDALIQKLDELIEKKQNIKQATMQLLLTGKKRLDGFEGEWEWIPLGQLSKITMGQSPSSSNYNTEGIGLPLVQGNADIQDRRTIIRNYTSQITKTGKKGDIIMSVRAPVGEVAKAAFDCCLGRGVCSISYENEFLYQYLLFIEPNWSKFSTGSTFDSINSNQLASIHIPIPKDKKEQMVIAKVLRDMDSEIHELENKRDKYGLVKQGIMQELLTGKTRLI